MTPRCNGPQSDYKQSFQLVFSNSNGGSSILPTLVLSQRSHNHCLQTVLVLDHGKLWLARLEVSVFVRVAMTKYHRSRDLTKGHIFPTFHNNIVLRGMECLESPQSITQTRYTGGHTNRQELEVMGDVPCRQREINPGEI